MIEDNEFYPINEKQLISRDATNEVTYLYNMLISSFNDRMNKNMEKVGGVKLLIEHEKLKHDKMFRDPSIYKNRFMKINTHSLFSHGWVKALSGEFDVNNNVYKFIDSIIEQITSEYSETGVPPDFFKRLSKYSMLEIEHGMACCKYYAWLEAGAINEDSENIEVSGLKTKYNTSQLTAIYKRLEREKVVNKSDLNVFLGIFIGNNSGKVYWNSDIKDAKPGLFDLMERLTEIEFTASQLKKYFYSNITIHDKWNGHTQGRLISKIIKGI